MSSMRSTTFFLLLAVLALAIGVNAKLSAEEQEISKQTIQERRILAPETNCNSKNCYDSCRKKGFRNGYCDKNLCRCTQPNMLDLVSGRHVDSKPKALCYNGDCNTSCRRMGYNSGYCVGLSCQCRNFLN